MQRRRNKVKDKPPPDPHREYLDAESSDEAERHGEEEVDVDELRPIYEVDELDELIRCIKDMTTLSGLTDNDWTWKCDMDIREFFHEPSIPVLCIYHVNGSLTTEFSFPTVPVHELTYFVRQPNEILYPENFRERILFGSMNDKVESHILDVIQNVFAPIFFTIETWPDSVKADFCTQLDTFLCNLTDLTYKMLGLTVIYVPLESREFTTEKGSADKDLVKRLEGVVAYWNTQIKIALSDQEQASPHELLCLDDEYDFWTYRYDNLCGLSYQLHKNTVEVIINILLTAQSTYIRQFLMLKDEIEHGIVEAKSNIEFLSILKDTCAELKTCTTPASVAQYLPKMMHLFRTIWLNSPYYNTRERISNLFSALSNQIIVMCKGFINLTDVFAGKSRKSMKIFDECIKLCEDYKTLYHKISNAHINLTYHSWDLDTKSIFRYINIFIGRCQDMIEICQAMIDFARLDETTQILSPKFSGTNGEEYERVCQKIERLFYDALSKIEANSHKIFAVHESTWHNDMIIFRIEIRDLEIMIENLIAIVFMNVNNIQEGIENLRSFYNYLNRKNMKLLFDSKNSSVWQILADDIQRTKQEVLNEREEYSSIAPYYAGRALNLRLKGDRLLSTRKILEKAEWMPYCGMSEEIYHQEDIVIRSIEDSIKDLYVKWLHDVDDNPRARLDRYLMRRSDSKPSLLECNIDPNILNLCRECFYWISLKFNIPVYIQLIYDKWDTLHFIYESVLAVTLAYNKIIEGLLFPIAY